MHAAAQDRDSERILSPDLMLSLVPEMPKVQAERELRIARERHELMSRDEVHHHQRARKEHMLRGAIVVELRPIAKPLILGRIREIRGN